MIAELKVECPFQKTAAKRSSAEGTHKPMLTNTASTLPYNVQ